MFERSRRRRTARVPRLPLVLLASLALLLPRAALAETSVKDLPGATLLPFAASFEVVYRGFNAGTTTLELTRESGDRWRYVSRNRAQGLFRLVLPGEPLQSSVLMIDAAGVRPLRYSAEDGTASVKNDIRLDFDWTAGRVRGVAEQKPVDLPIAPGLQDGMSVQLALMHALAGGAAPTGFMLIDKTEIRQYRYVAEGRTTVRTAVGELETVIWTSQSSNSSRITRVWYAPSLGFLPVRAERRAGDTVEWSMRLASLRR